MKQLTNRTLLVLLPVLALLFIWAQSRILHARAGYRVEEKILMLSDRPEITRVFALGFDGTLADMLWIRGIQYFGGNFSSLEKSDKRQGMMNLLRNLVGLDPHFVSAYLFGGFVINESMKQPEEAMNFMIQGAENNPENWRLPFDAGFTAFYQLKDYEVAKQLFIRSTYGVPYEGIQIVEAGGVSQEQAEAVLDGDPDTTVAFPLNGGSLILDLGERKLVGRVVSEQHTGQDETYRLLYSSSLDVSKFIEKETITFQEIGVHTFEPAALTQRLKLDQFQSQAADGQLSLNEIKVYGARNPNAPSYVERMAIEMDRASGRFLAAWSQYERYYQEAETKGDEISAMLARQKLVDIYSLKCMELLKSAAELYQKETGKIPSMNMQELVDEGYLQRIIDQQIAEDPKFILEVYPVLIHGNQPINTMLRTFDGAEPHLLIQYTNKDGQQDWYLISRLNLISNQKDAITSLQKYVNQYKEETGSYPKTLHELVGKPWFPSSEEILEDPLGGEFVVDPQTGTVSAINPKY